jgi:hypothetical protein
MQLMGNWQPGVQVKFDFLSFSLSFLPFSLVILFLNQTLDPYSLSLSSLSSSHQIEPALKVKSLKLGSLKSFAKISQSALSSSHQGHHHQNTSPDQWSPTTHRQSFSLSLAGHICINLR